MRPKLKQRQQVAPQMQSVSLIGLFLLAACLVGASAAERQSSERLEAKQFAAGQLKSGDSQKPLSEQSGKCLLFASSRVLRSPEKSFPFEFLCSQPLCVAPVLPKVRLARSKARVWPEVSLGEQPPRINGPQ